jgi:signal transduction histidine kinase
MPGLTEDPAGAPTARGAIPGAADATAQAVAAEWIVAFLRPVGLVAFSLIGWLKPPTHPVDLSLLWFFVAVGALYAVYIFHLLTGGRVARELPHYLSFFLVCDILLLVALTYFSNIFHQGLLFFFHLLIIVVALRANFRFSLAIGPIMIVAYYLSVLLAADEVSSGRFALDALGLVGVALVCGWFAEGRSKAWRLVRAVDRDLASAASDLDEARHELDVLRRSQELQRDFFAIVSHELRTPLTGIIGYSDLMLLGEVGRLEERQREYIREIMGKGIDLLNLIDNILNIHKVQSGRWSLRLRPVDPARLVEDALATIRPEALKKGVALDFEREGELPEMIADGDKVKLVLLNILANAVRYTPPGRRVRVAAEVVVDTTLEARFPHLISSAEAVRILIADEGPGIAAADRPHVFELFYRGRGLARDSSPSRMGLGLAVAKEIVELHWGRIWIEEATGGGSQFCFTLPLRPLRTARRVALVTSSFRIETIIEGLLLQFNEELRKKRLTVERTGWPAADGRPYMLTADRQLVQSVLFNIFNNNLRYAYPGTGIFVSIDRLALPERVRIRLANRGEILHEGLVEQVNRGEPAPSGPENLDLRHVHVNLALARDIIESHGGTFLLENLGRQGAAVTIVLAAT